MPERIIMKRYILLMVIYSLISAACSNTGKEDGSMGIPVYEMDTKLSIGRETGDSCYTFGEIVDACVLKDGNIAVLDGITCAISLYSPDGTFNGRTGGSGQGPGEFVGPSSMAALQDGRIAVSDPGMARMTFLHPDLEVDTVINGFVPWSPERISPSRGGSYTGSYRIFHREDSMYGRLVALWSNSAQQDIEYYNRLAPFNTERLRESTEECQVCFTSDYSGNVYYSPYSYTDYEVVALDPTGDELYSITDERSQCRRSSEEIEEEREEMSRELEREGAPPEMQWNPSEYRPMIPIRGLGVDSAGCLWVRDGREDEPVFDVYLEGELLYQARAQGLFAPDEDITVKVRPNGILAWSTNPSVFPAVHLLGISRS